MIRHGSTRVRNCQPIVRSVIEFVFSLGKQMDAVSQRERGKEAKFWPIILGGIWFPALMSGQ